MCPFYVQGKSHAHPGSKSMRSSGHGQPSGAHWLLKDNVNIWTLIARNHKLTSTNDLSYLQISLPRKKQACVQTQLQKRKGQITPTSPPSSIERVLTDVQCHNHSWDHRQLRSVAWMRWGLDLAWISTNRHYLRGILNRWNLIPLIETWKGTGATIRSPRIPILHATPPSGFTLEFLNPIK